MTSRTRNIFTETDIARIERRTRIVRTQQDWACAVAQFRKNRKSN